MFENMSNNFAFFAFKIMSTLNFGKIFLKIRTLRSISIIIFLMILNIISFFYLYNTFIWILNLFYLIKFIYLVIKASIRWIIVFFNCLLTLLEICYIWCINWIILISSMNIKFTLIILLSFINYVFIVNFLS